ncbi:hypothetical protein [Alkalibacterium indicireducens]|uniref:Tetratricopeptide repeat-containing protein n=1 Tax=Alkalibacterium indicireducens TaxID=398758 RepID=A0ABP3LB57_9LACT
MVKQVNYYTELELNSDLSSEELGKQLKAIIRKWRNRTTAPDQEVRHKAEKKMEMAEEAIGILTDETKKAAYDIELIEQNKNQMNSLEHHETEQTSKRNFQEEYTRIYNKANDFIELEDFNETMNLAKELIDMNPKDWRGWEIAGRVYHNNDIELAKNYYQKAIQLEKNVPAYVYSNLGIAQKVLGETVEAFISFQNSLDIFPSFDRPLKECNNLLKYMDIDSVLPFFEQLKEKRNDVLVFETLANAYSLKADSLVQEIDHSPCFTSKEQIQKYIELIDKAKFYSEKSEMNEKITKAKHALGKEFDKSKIPVLVFPLISVLSILNSGRWSISVIFAFLISSLILAVIIDASIRPRYEINRWKFEGKGTFYDKVVDKTYVKDSLKWTMGIWFLLITVLSPITTLLYLSLAVYLVHNKFFPETIQKKSLQRVKISENGDIKYE